MNKAHSYPFGSAVIYEIIDHSGTLVSSIDVSSRHKLFNEEKPINEEELPSISYHGRFYHINDLPSISGIDIAEKIIDMAKGILRANDSQYIVTINVVDEGVRHPTVTFTLDYRDPKGDKADIAKLPNSHYAYKNKNKRYIYVDTTPLLAFSLTGVIGEYLKLWEISIEDHSYFIATMNFDLAWKLATYYQKLDGLDPHATISIRNVSREEYRTQLIQYKRIMSERGDD